MPTPLNDALERLVAREVLTPEQARAVRDEVAAPATRSVGGRPRRGVSPAAEVAAYLGGSVTTIALAFLVAEPYADAPRGVRSLMMALLSLLLVLAGFGLRDPDGEDRVRERLSGSLWVLAVGAAGWSAAALTADTESAGVAITSSGGVALALAVPLYLLQRSIGQVVAVVASLLVTLGGLVAIADWGNVGGGFAFAAFGAVVVALGLARVLSPAGVTVPGGAALALIGLQVVAFTEDWRAPVLGIAVAACVALFVVATREGAVVAAVATIGMTAALPQAISHFGGEGISAPVLLLVTGVALLGGAALTNRIRRGD